MTTHRRLREATHPDHEVVDAAFARFDLGRRADYIAFLQAHAAALGAAEPAVSPEGARLPLLAADLAALGADMPPPLPFAPPGDEPARWGLRYTLEGSRLGGAMLARTVGPGLPAAFLSARHGPGEWRAFCAALDDEVRGEADLASAITASRAVFGLYATAAAASDETHGGR